MSQTSICQVEIAGYPGEIARLVAERLTGSGVGVGPPRLDDEGCLHIACRAARCALMAHDDGLVTWEWCPDKGRALDPDQLADMACTLLIGQIGEQPRPEGGCRRPPVTLKGIVGRKLAAQGLTVGLEVYEDLVSYDVDAAIRAANPRGGPDAHICLTDDGCLTWECDFGTEIVPSVGTSRRKVRIASPGELAADIATRVTVALSVMG